MKKSFILIVIFFLINNLYSQIPIVNYEIKYFQKNDTIFRFQIFSTDGKIDSVLCTNFYKKLTKNKWVSNDDSDEGYTITKFKKLKRSKLLMENKDKLLYADFECETKYRKTIFNDGSATIMRRIWILTYMKNKPPK